MGWAPSLSTCSCKYGPASDGDSEPLVEVDEEDRLTLLEGDPKGPNWSEQYSSTLSRASDMCDGIVLMPPMPGLPLAAPLPPALLLPLLLLVGAMRERFRLSGAVAIESTSIVGGGDTEPAVADMDAAAAAAAAMPFTAAGGRLSIGGTMEDGCRYVGEPTVPPPAEPGREPIESLLLITRAFPVLQANTGGRWLATPLCRRPKEQRQSNRQGAFVCVRERETQAQIAEHAAASHCKSQPNSVSHLEQKAITGGPAKAAPETEQE